MRVRVLQFLAMPAILLGGCGSTGDYPVGRVTGRVVCEGHPVPNVRVFFEPISDSATALIGKQGFAVANKDGTFVLSTYGEGDGAVIGQHRVRVNRPHPEDFPGFDCPCVMDSETDVMKVEVKSGKNEFEVVLKKKTGREKPRVDAKDD